MQMLSPQQVDTPKKAARRWDQRAEFWQKERAKKRKGDERVFYALSLLERRGILTPDREVVDIGCGPGRFAAAFAKRVKRVLGLDISEKMVAHGQAYLVEQGLTNAVLQVCDFKTLDVEKAGLLGAFDLVFGSMTPAIHDMEGLLKSMSMSRAWCCNVTHLSGRNYMREQIMRDVFGQELPPQWSGKWFYALFNTLFLLGYEPETSYETRHSEIRVSAEEEYAAFITEHMLPEHMHTAENTARILDWLRAHVDEQGLITEISDTTYGTILWDVRRRTPRPSYDVPGSSF
ncbi:MAG: class I SAM-dependent methyltransferase [Clostridia bacterium]|nr:class I SAM-dependent methyltransferase [Clostridia bacterium]